MSDLTAKFEALESQLTSEHLAQQAALDAMSARLDEFSITFDTMIENNAVNTRLLLAAIGQNSPCMPCPTPPLVIPPLGETVIPVDEEACQRGQAFISFMEQAFTVLDLASSVGIGFTPTLVSDAFAQVIEALTGGGDSPPIISFPEAVSLVGQLINYVVLNLLRGATLSGSFSPLVSDLRDALYTAGSPGGAAAAYNGIVASSSLDSDIKAVLTTAAYNGLYSYFFDPASEPDLSGFDGGLCSIAPGTCYEREFETCEMSGAGSGTTNAVVEAFGPFTPATSITSSSGVVTSDLPQFFAGSLDGWTIEVTTGSAIVYYRAGGLGDSGVFSETGFYGVDSIAHSLPASGSFFIRGFEGAVIELCVAEE